MEHVDPIFFGDPKTAGMKLLGVDRMEKIVLVHLSDIHFTRASGVSVHDLDKNVGVLVTGDIAFSGSEAEFAYDAAGNSRLEYDEWEWMREYAPPSSYWRDWDKCERLAKAMARLLDKQNASLETVFAVVHSRPAIRKVAAVLDDDRDTRAYLKSLRKAVEASSIGTREQRDALLEGR